MNSINDKAAKRNIQIQYNTDIQAAESKYW